MPKPWRPKARDRRSMACAPFIRALNEAGWEKRYDSRAGGSRTVEFFKFFGLREVSVQLWEDGQHRATNMIYRDKEKRSGRCSTPPTVFQTIDGMWLAVRTERLRTDHPAPLSVSEWAIRHAAPQVKAVDGLDEPDRQHPAALRLKNAQR